MANPLFNLLNGNNNQQQLNGMQEQFDNFKKTVTGDPQSMVQHLRDTGQMSEQQFQQLSQLANVLHSTLK